MQSVPAPVRGDEKIASEIMEGAIEQAVAYLADHPPEDQEDVSPGPLASKPRVTVEQAIEACLCDAVRRSVESSALKKLESFFRKQVLAWTRVEGVAYLGG